LVLAPSSNHGLYHGDFLTSFAGRKLVKLTVAAFAIVALGVGTFTWAKTIKDGQAVLKDCMIAKSAQAIECQKR
jgi:hypothetical protein